MILSEEQLKAISAKSLSKQLKEVRAQCLKPPSKLTLSRWADTYRVLSSEASAAPGKWNTATAEYQREMLDAVSSPEYEQVVFCTSAQIGKTEILLNMILYHIHQEPAPMLLVQPTKELAGSFSKDRLAPAIRDSKSITTLVSDVKSRDTNNTILSKSFPGGVLNVVGSNAPSSLASRPVRCVFADEVDRYPLSAGTEGDPLQLAIKRSSNFWNRKIVMVSTPTDKLISRIWARYEASDQRKYHIKCAHCGDYFVPEWIHVKWNKDEGGTHLPETAQLYCPHCGSGHNDTQRKSAVSKGKWVADNPTSKVAGFHLSALISPWAELEKLVTEWVSAQKDVQRLKTFFNTQLGLPWEDRSDNIDDVDFLNRLEDYDVATIPNDVAMLTAGCDVQDDRIEASVYGYGEQNESWHIDHQIFHGNPANPATWKALEDYLKTRYRREDGITLPVAAACIDSGGHFTQECYAFCKKHSQRRWFAIKGRAGNHPIFPSRASHTKNDGKVYLIGVDSAKEAIYAWLKNPNKGPGYVHFSDRCDTEFFSQLSAEKKVLTYRNGFTYYSWKKEGARRNEVLDCFVYSLAAKEALNVSITAIKRRLDAKRVGASTTPEKASEKDTVSATNQPEKAPEVAQKAPEKAVQIPSLPQQKIPKWKQNLAKSRRGF